MSTIDTVSSLLETYGLQETAASDSDNSLDKDAFLELLVTQMQYQDPLEPQTDQEYLAQMAQFSALEQMQNLNTSFNMSQASALIDKYVQGIVRNDLTGEITQVVGIVDAVNMKDGEPYLLVEDQEMALTDVDSVISDFGMETRALIEALEGVEEQIENIEEYLGIDTSEEDEDTVEATDSTDSSDTDTTDSETDTTDTSDTTTT